MLCDSSSCCMQFAPCMPVCALSSSPCTLSQSHIRPSHSKCWERPCPSQLQPAKVSKSFDRVSERKKKRPLPLLLKVKEVGNKRQEVNKRTHIYSQAEKQQWSKGPWEQRSMPITPRITYKSLSGRRMSGQWNAEESQTRWMELVNVPYGRCHGHHGPLLKTPFSLPHYSSKFWRKARLTPLYLQGWTHSQKRLVQE